MSTGYYHVYVATRNLVLIQVLRREETIRNKYIGSVEEWSGK